MRTEVDIFVSYKSEERGLADIYRTAFIAAGYSVVSDVELNDGVDFGKAIDQMIRSARLVVVLWTPAATQSDWVLSEARLAVSLEKYQGVWLAEDKEPVDLLPVGLFDLQHHTFQKGLTDTAKVRDLLEKIRTRLGAPVNAETAAEISNAVTAEMTIYESVASLNRIEAYEGYLEAYPNGRFIEAAQKEIKNLSSWRTKVRPYLPSLSVMSLAVGVAGLGVGYMQVPPETWQLDAAKTEINNLTAQLKNKGVVEQEVAAAQTAQRQAEAALSSVITDRDTARTQRDQFSDTVAKQRHNLSDATERAAAATNDVKRLEQEVKASTAAVKSARAALADAKATNARETAGLQAKLTDALKAAEMLKRNLAVAEGKARQANTDLRSTQGQLTEAKAKIKTLTGERDAALAELKELKPVLHIECETDGQNGVQIIDMCFPLTSIEVDLQGHSINDDPLSEADLAGLIQLQDASRLTVTWRDNDFTSVLAQMPNLKSVWARGTKMNSLDWVSGTPLLRTLVVINTQVSDVKPLLNLSKLRFLALSGTEVKDFSPLKSMKTLTQLYLRVGDPLKGEALEKWKNE